MNKDKQTIEYVSQLQNLKLSASARTRMEDSLLEYARFHPVRVELDSRSIEQVPQSTYLQRFNLTTMPIAIFLILFISVGTSFAAQGALPGDFLYPIKTEVNENVRTAFAFGADAEANLQADLLEERLEEAQTLHTEGKLTANTAVMVSNNIQAQAKVASVAAAKSESSVAMSANTRIQMALENFLAIGGLDATLASEVGTTLNASSLATGTYPISSYQSDQRLRASSLQVVLVRYQTELGASVYAELTVKVEAATVLVAESEAMAEAEARTTLDEAAMLLGEVESKLSTLGQAEVDGNTGIITDIDFSIDPMIIDRGDESVASPEAQPVESGVNADVELDSEINLEVIDVDLNTNLEATSGLRL